MMASNKNKITKNNVARTVNSVDNLITESRASAHWCVSVSTIRARECGFVLDLFLFKMSIVDSLLLRWIDRDAHSIHGEYDVA